MLQSGRSHLEAFESLGQEVMRAPIRVPGWDGEEWRELLERNVGG